MTATAAPEISFDEQIALVRNAEPRVRRGAVAALGRLGDARAVEALSAALKQDDVPDVRARSASALGQIGDHGAINPLCQALTDRDAEVRRRAAQALSRFGEACTLEPLVAALNDSDRDVRRWAARALGLLGESAALQQLARVRSSDPNVVVQEEAAQAVRAIEDRLSLAAQRTKIDELRRKRNRADPNDTLAEVRLDGQIDLEQLGASRLEARIAAREVTPPPPDEGAEQDRGRRSLVYELQGTIRELESLSTNTRAAHMRAAWENQLRDTRAALMAWSNGGAGLSLDDMRAEMARFRERVDGRFDAQSREQIELNRLAQTGYNHQLQIAQILDTLTDPTNRAKVGTWSQAAEAECNLLKMAREQGDCESAEEHHARLTELRERAEQVQDLERRATSDTGRRVILFIAICMVGLCGVIYGLNAAGLLATSVPGLGVPYTVVAWAALGSVAAMLYQFINNPVSQLETVKWLIARPIQGIIMGSFLYLAVAAGLLLLGNPTNFPQEVKDTIRPEMAGVIAFLGGFSDRFADETVKRVTAMLARGQSEETNAPAQRTSSGNGSSA